MLKINYKIICSNFTYPNFSLQYAANMKKDPFDFVGDFHYDEPRRDEKFRTMAHITEACVKRFDESRGYVPKRLILFRNGQAEGQYANSLQYEVG